MTSDFSLVSYTTKCNPVEFAVQSLSNRLAKRCFTYAWRSIEAQNRPLVVFCELSDCQELYNPLLYHIESKVVPFEHL